MFGRIIVRFGSTVYRGGVRQLNDYSASAAVEVDSATDIAPLMDTHGRRHDYLRISLTERCNLRCQYCMPAEGVPLCPSAQLLTTEEVITLASEFARLGVSKIRLTGGEPTLRRDLAHVVQELKAIPGIRTLAMTTNGLVLTRRLAALQRAGLDALNVSLDSLRPERYERLARRPGLPRVLAGIDFALQLGYQPLKINTVLMKGFNDDEICDFVEFTRDRAVEVRFIEFMPFTGNRWDDSRMVPYRAALRLVTRQYPDLQPLAPRPNDTARVWQLPGAKGSVGFIASMTQPFCGTCNRLRLTADGNLKVCLFGSAEVSLRDALRGGGGGGGGEQLRDVIRAALRNKKAQHAAAAGAGAGWSRVAARAYSTLSHVDAGGRARMVDVSGKRVTQRRAAAACRVSMSAELLELLRSGGEGPGGKGAALCVARVAGTLAAKRTADLIPMCHPLPLQHVSVDIVLTGTGARVTCAVACEARTGAEMEALTGAAVAALTLYDMCKSVDKHMIIDDLRLVSKSGGKSDYPPPPAESTPPPPPASPPPPSRTDGDAPGVAYAPVNLVHF